MAFVNIMYFLKLSSSATLEYSQSVPTKGSNLASRRAGVYLPLDLNFAPNERSGLGLP